MSGRSCSTGKLHTLAKILLVVKFAPSEAWRPHRLAAHACQLVQSESVALQMSLECFFVSL
eukprot:616890-Amphidinium_carterae.1